MVFGSGKKCHVCGIDGQGVDFELQGIRFDSLEGDPWICERCVAAILGFQGCWKEAIVEQIQAKIKTH